MTDYEHIELDFEWGGMLALCMKCRYLAEAFTCPASICKLKHPEPCESCARVKQGLDPITTCDDFEERREQ